jgi:hypothetical protein
MIPYSRGGAEPAQPEAAVASIRVSSPGAGPVWPPGGQSGHSGQQLAKVLR